jgi:sporulation protein YlmC with PRC-barrel domain
MENAIISAAEFVSSDDVEGKSVYNVRGEKLGSIDDLMIDKNSGRIQYAVMEFGGFLGMGKDRYPVPWGVLKYDVEKDGYIVPLDKKMLEGAPKYTDQDIPTYDRSYAERVDRYYNNPL